MSKRTLTRPEKIERRWVSETLRRAVKTDDRRQYILAQLIGRHPSVLSAQLCGIVPVHADDPRIAALGQLVGVSAARCFSKRSPRAATQQLRKLAPPDQVPDAHQIVEMRRHAPQFLLKGE